MTSYKIFQANSMSEKGFLEGFAVVAILLLIGWLDISNGRSKYVS